MTSHHRTYRHLLPKQTAQAIDSTMGEGSASTAGQATTDGTEEDHTCMVGGLGHVRKVPLVELVLGGL